VKGKRTLDSLESIVGTI